MHSRFTFFPWQSVLRLSCRWVVGIASVLMISCGGAAGPDYRSPYVSLSGTISSSGIATPSQVRVALVWKHRDPEGNLLRVAQELAVSAQFPVRFRLDITALPPVEALNQRHLSDGTYDPDWRYATGTLLVYDDVDGNGVLDLLSIDAETTVDRVLGAPEHLSVFYVEGTSVRRGGSGPQPGFNLRREPLLADPPPGDSTCVPVGSQEYLPLSTEIPVSLTAAPELSREMCAVMPPFTGGGCTGPRCTSAPVGAQVTCNADRTAFVSKLCQAPRGLCGSTSCEYGCGRLAPGDPVPPEWPCR